MVAGDVHLSEIGTSSAPAPDQNNGDDRLI